MASPRLKFLMAVLHAYSAITGEPVRNGVTVMRVGGSPMENATVVEDVGQATWEAVKGEGLPLAPRAQVYFLARAFDDGEARLVVLERERVIFNEIWQCQGNLRDWLTQCEDLAQAIRQRAQWVSMSTASSTIHIQRRALPHG